MENGLVSAESLGHALDLWRQAIGEQHVLTAPADLSRAESTTFPARGRVPAILEPASTVEVQACLRIANMCRQPVYPVSSGRNWGYGSRLPPAPSSVLLHLGRMRRIVDFSEKLAYVTVEAGVTQRQLYEFLRERKSSLWMDATGSSPECSLVGNTMERGFGHTPFGDHASFVCGFEVVLPDGEVIRTGAARHPGSRTAALVRWGTGPNLDGLFSQSNLGVVTQLTVWLMAEPECFEAFFFRAEQAEHLPALVDVLAGLRLQEILRSAIHVGNDYRVLSGIQQYPWRETGGKTPLPDALLARFRKDLGFGAWNASGGLYGSRQQVAEAKGALRRTLRAIPGSLRFLSPRTLRMAKRFAKPFRAVANWNLERTIGLVEPVVGLMQGVPTSHTLSSAYWRKRMPVPPDPDPDRDRCGLLWYSPTTPADGSQVQELTTALRKTMLTHGFEPAMSLTLISPRAIFCVVSLAYDRDVDGEDERANACYADVKGVCEGQGFYPYRLGISNMHLPTTESYDKVTNALKTALDPNGILAPGRYGM